MNLAYVVITSVDRDDLPDGGSAHYAQCIREVRERSPRTVVETLIPDYQGSDLETLMAARPDVLAHNVEVVGRLQRKIRDPRCSFERSLETLRGAKRLDAERVHEVVADARPGRDARGGRRVAARSCAAPASSS